MMSNSLFSSLLFFLLSLLVSSSNTPAVFLFGDSILDAGNNGFIRNCSVQANFPPYGQDFFHHPTGRFTNGRTVADFLAEAIGVDLQKPYLEVDMLVKSGKLSEYPSNGINFASAGSGVLKETNEKMGVMPLQAQLQQFEALVKGNKIDKKIVEQALYVFETGSNDIFFYFLSTENPRPTPDALISSMVSEFELAVQRVYELGARRIAIFGLGPVGCIPARLNLPGAVAEHCYPQANEMAVSFNLALEAFVNQIPANLHGAVGVYAGTYEVVAMFLTYPQHYGFNNTASACCGEGTLRGCSQCGTGKFELCKDPDHYVFWDYFHPTEHAYNLIFKAFWNGKSSQARPINLENLVNITFSLA